MPYPNKLVPYRSKPVIPYAGRSGAVGYYGRSSYNALFARPRYGARIYPGRAVAKRRWNGRMVNYRRRKPAAYRGFYNTSKFEKKYYDIVLPGFGGNNRYPTNMAIKTITSFNSISENSTIALSSNSFLPNTDTTGGIYLHTIPQGTNIQGRIGEKVTLASFQCKLILAPNFDGTYEYFTGSAPSAFINRYSYSVRMMLILDTQNNGGTGGVDQTALFEYNSNGMKPFSPLDMSNRGRYNVLMDKLINIDEDSGERVGIDIYKKLKIPIYYTGTLGNQSECRSNALFLCFFPDQEDVGNVHVEPGIVGVIRMRYWDA